MIEPISLLSNLTGSITATVTLSNLVLGLRNCPEEVKTCFSLVHLVNADIQHAVKLRTKHRDMLAQRPVDAKRMDDIITSASESLTSIGALCERLNADAYGGKVPYKKRLRWVLGDSASFDRRTRDLQAQHSAIQQEIAWLRSIELVVPLHSLVETNTAFDNFDLWKSKQVADNGNGDDYKPGIEPDRPSLPPRTAAPSKLCHVPSAETLVGSISDMNRVQPSPYVDRWVESRRDSDQDYYGACSYAELPGSSDFGEHVFPSSASLEVGSISPGVGSTSLRVEEEDEDEMGSFFRGWRENQAERRQQDAYVD